MAASSTAATSTGKWRDYIRRVETLPAQEQRRIAAVVGAIVADAAAQPLHWIYDEAKMQRILTDKVDPAFYPVSQNPFYTLNTGCQSPYGDQLLLVLKCLAKCHDFDANEFAKEYNNEFNGSDTGYKKSHQQQAPSSYPIRGRWTTAVIRDFVEKYTSKQPTGNASSLDPDALVSIIPVMAHYSGRRDYLATCRRVYVAMQMCDMVVGSALMAARILERYVVGVVDEESTAVLVLGGVLTELKSSSEAVDKEMARCLEEVLQADGNMSATEATEHFGKA